MKNVVFILLTFWALSCNTKNEAGQIDKYQGYVETFNQDGIIILKNEKAFDEPGKTKKVDSFFAETSYACIRQFSENLVNKLQPPGKPYEIPFGLKNFPLFIEMKVKDEKAELGKLIYESKSEKLLAVFGIDHYDRFTVSFLALDGNNIHPGHLNGTLQGEETWPVASVTYVGSEIPTGSKIERRLPPASSKCEKFSE